MNYEYAKKHGMRKYWEKAAKQIEQSERATGSPINEAILRDIYDTMQKKKKSFR